MRGLGRRRISDGPRGGGPRSGTAAAPVGSTRPSDPMRIGRRSFIRRAVPRAMVALSFIRANVLKRRRSLAGRRLVSSSRRPRVVSTSRVGQESPVFDRDGSESTILAPLDLF